MRCPTFVMLLVLLSSFAVWSKQFMPAPVVSIASHDAFFENIRKHCGKAYEGKIVVDNPASGGFKGRLIMHVRKCSDHELHIPFHVGENRSRTWIIKKTGSGLSLKHDHRKRDGSFDEQTMYGGHTLDAGWPTFQAFPADQYSKESFVEFSIPQSNGNTWEIYMHPDTFSYRLIRQGREFRVDFNLAKPISPPPAPWGYEQSE